jgi:hypothetical protein
MVEARYLIAILNSETARARAAQFQSRGQWGARDFDKVIFNLPIPRFDGGESLHLDLAAAAARAEEAAALVELPDGAKFQRARGLSGRLSPKPALRKRSTRSWQGCSTGCDAMAAAVAAM